MNLNELRIGSYYHWYADGICYEMQMDQKDFIGENYKNFEPIPITDIWPEKLGFKQVKFDYVIPISECGVCTMTLIAQDDLCSSFSVMVTQSDDSDPDESVFLEDVSFVHELQNLYFGITKKELIKRK